MPNPDPWNMKFQNTLGVSSLHFSPDCTPLIFLIKDRIFLRVWGKSCTFAPVFKRLVIFLCFFLLSVVSCKLSITLAQQDTLRVSLLTCSPGQEVYSLYGHTAIRVQVPKDSIDEVFNYGVFDFRKPHFTWHFVLGQTDYMIEPLPWKYFIIDYDRRGSSITEQELNLTPSEANCLLAALIENCQPENREYRYSFLYNNCTTKVRDMVEQVVRGNIQYPDTLPHQTAREILHHYTAQHPWAQEGNDLLLGSEMDTILSERAAMFIPENMMQAFDGAYILSTNGDMRPLVRSKKVILEAKQQVVEPEFPLSPLQAILVFAVICILILVLEVWTKRLWWLWDVLILLLQGIAGTLLTFMFLFSEHPGVDSNWQIWLLNPIYFIGIPLVIKAATKHKETLWYAFYFAVLALFLLFSPWIPQVFAKITVPLALCLLTRPLSYYYFRHRKKKHGRK